MKRQTAINEKTAIDFLLYSMLGVTIDDTGNKDEGVKAAIIRAYSDATMQGAYNSLFKKDLKNREGLLKASAEARRESGKMLLEELDKFFQEDSPLDDYDKWHRALCKAIVGKYENVCAGDKPFFTYGNAQKWVNMTIKYLCILDALSDGSIYHTRLLRFRSKFHIPVDSYIIEAVSPKKPGPSWSKWGASEYKAFQAAGKKQSGDAPLDWENTTWINQSKRRKRREKSSLQDKYPDFFGDSEKEC